MKRTRYFWYCLFSALLLSQAWYGWGTGLLLLVAFVPLLAAEDRLYQDRANNRPHKFFFYSFLTFALWNLMTTWWIWNASPAGMFLAVIFNSFLMSVIMWLFHITRRNAGNGPAYFGLIVYWLVYEHFYMNGEIAWPWLNLGYGFAGDIRLVQWYEYTGSFGGALWVLLSNVIAFNLVRNFSSRFTVRRHDGGTGGSGTRTAANLTGSHPSPGNYFRPAPVLALWTLLVAGPIALSLVRFHNYKDSGDPVEVVVVQPNIDPYNEKFTGNDMDSQMQKMLRLADSLGTRQTDYFVAPETFINDNLWLGSMNSNRSILEIRHFLHKYPQAEFIVGATCYRRYYDPDSASVTAMPLRGTADLYDSYNASLQIDTGRNIPVYRKSKLVVGVEKMPYPGSLKFLRNLTLRLGGTFRSHGTQENRTSFASPREGRDVRIGTPICYESVFGEFVTEYVNAGATLLFIITNDGWWGDTPGYRQHQRFASLRAIETRRSVARSANTGISSLIDQKGRVLQSAPWWTDGALRGTLKSNHATTFYTRHGDFIPRAAYFFALIILLYTLVRVILKR